MPSKKPSKPSPDKQSLRISEFPKGNDVWRIDWFGEVQFPNRLLLWRHPSVNVYLSRVTDPQALSNPQALLSPRATAPVEHQKQCTLSVGKLMLLRIGDLWQSQRLIACPDYEQETFRDLQIDRDTATLVKAGVSLEEGGFLLPLSEHPWHRRNTYSYCLRVTLPDGRCLVIPCIELIRFYFGSSSELLNLLFRPGLSKDRLFKSCKLNPTTRFMGLALSDHVHPRSAADIGRIAGSAAAWRAANLGLSSCLKGIATGQGPFPQGIFPFEGKTDLIVSGKWLSRSGRERQTFLVYQIHSCSHPFPFNFLRYTGGRRKAKRDQDQEQDALAKAAQPRSKSATSDDPTLVEKDPSDALASTVRAVDAKRSFPDLDRKPVFGSKTIEARIPSRPGKQHIPIEEESAGETGSQHKCRAVSLIDAVDVAGEAPEWLSEAYRMLREIPGLKIELLTCSDTDGWSVPLPLYADDDGVIDDRLLVPEGELWRARRAAAFRIVAEGRATVLVVVEAPVLTTMAYSSKREDAIDLAEALRRTATEPPVWAELN